MSEDNEALRRLIPELQLLESIAEGLRSRIGLVNSAISEFHAATSTMEGLKQAPTGATILVPIGGGSFVKAKVMDYERLILDVGANVTLEKSFDEAREELETRIRELEKSRANLQAKLQETESNLNKMRNQVRELSQRLQQGNENVRRA
jgi:prefoldin alpha subunit